MSLPSGAQQLDSTYLTQHLSSASYDIGPDASAIVLFERTEVEISEEYAIYARKETVHRVIRILKSDAISSTAGNLANIRVFVPQDDIHHAVTKIKATTYNLENGTITESKLAAQDIFKKNDGKAGYEISFSMPNAKVGSIIEYSYEMKAKFTGSTETWQIQELYPKLVTEFQFRYTDHFAFTSIANVRQPQKEFTSEIDAAKSPDEFCHVKRTDRFDQVFYSSFWSRKNVSVVSSEPFVHNMNNMEERIELQLTGTRSAEGAKSFNHTWEKINKQFWDTEGLGKEITGNNNYMDDVTDSIKKLTQDQLERAKLIYSFVRNNFSIDNSRSYSSKKGVYETFKKRQGSKYEINLLLTALLFHADIDASPVLISTTDEVSFISSFPVISRLNFIACLINIDSNLHILDATKKYNTFGTLPSYCYNGFAWVLNFKGYGIELMPGALSEKNVYATRIADFTDSTASVDIMIKPGILTAQKLREYWAKNENNEKQFLEQTEMALPAEISITNHTILGRNNPDTSLIIRLTGTFSFDSHGAGIAIPVQVARHFTTNPLKAVSRRVLPVEFSKKDNYDSYVTVSLPPGMIPKQIPQPVEEKLRDDGMIYRNNVTYNPDLKILTIAAKFETNSVDYEASQYDELRNFFQKVIETSNTSIVLNNK